MKDIVHILNVSKKPVFQATTSLMTGIVTVSRLKYKPDLMPVKSICPLPQDLNYTKNFADTTIERGAEIWQQHAVNDELNLLWSGGIDSTVALTSLLMNCKANQKINVFCNINSINENSSFYSKLLKNKNVNLVNSSNMPENKPMTCITGELGDQIFGSDLLFKIVNTIGIEALKEDYEKVILRIFIGRCGEQWGSYLFKRYQPIVEEAPFKIKTSFDFVWWWNFTQKWQCVKFRKNCLTASNINSVHFFESESYQKWSINNHSEKIGNTVQSYKMPAKQFIYSYDANKVYLEQKRKYGSPFGSKFHYFVLYEDGSKIYTWDECNQLIDKITGDYSY